MFRPVAIDLYVVHGSHPCVAVERALEMKGLAFRRIELPPPLQAPVQKVLFGARTVPAMRLDDGEKVSGSMAIMRRLESLAPTPPLWPAEERARALVERAEEWGDEVLQQVARRLTWASLKRDHSTIGGFLEGSRLGIPQGVAVRTAAPLVHLSARLNDATDEAARADIAALPGHLDRVDAWIAEGVLGGSGRNAADFQIATSVRLLMALDDLRPAIEDRPAGRLAIDVVPNFPGRTNPVFPSAWLAPLDERTED
jgi:glutathione S-transferase